MDVQPHILDSGDRTQFTSGAVRDMRKGKGRCDLLPLDIAGYLCEDDVLIHINGFLSTNNVDYLYSALRFAGIYPSQYTMLLEVAKHFEEGAAKYGDNNWRKGISPKVYVDSAVRHYLKYRRGDTDEPHDRAFCWNILCCIWTVTNLDVDALERTDAGQDSVV